MLVAKPPHTLDRAAIAHLDVLLDEALRQTFPASDPIAITIEVQLSRPTMESRRGCAPIGHTRKARRATIR